MLKRLLLLLVCLVSCPVSCAPPPQPLSNEFVPNDELLTVGLVREGLGYAQAGRLIDAELKLRQAHYLAPSAKNIRVNLAIVLERNGLFDEARAILHKLIKENPSHLPYYTSLGQLEFMADNFKASTQAYNKAMQMALDRSEAAFAGNVARSLATINFKYGLEEDALCNSESALTFKQDMPELMRHTKLLRATNNFSKAKTKLTTFMEQRPGTQDPALLFELAMANAGLESYKEALEYERLALQSPNIDSTTVFEAQLLRFITDYKLGADPVEEKKERLQEFFSTKRELGRLALYWPPNVVEAFHELESKYSET